MQNEFTQVANRRAFLKRTGLIAYSVSMSVLGSCADDNSPEPDNTCLTTSDILGPYYKAGSPVKENVIPDGDISPPLNIQGIVFNGCDNPVSNATVEIWNANSYGEYDLSDLYLYRGANKTGSDGMYRFKTIIPGRYLNGNTYRPSHIHFRTTAPGFKELVSQVYFKDDPYLSGDPWASAANAKQRILEIGKDANDQDTITFDIHLEPL